VNESPTDREAVPETPWSVGGCGPSVRPPLGQNYAKGKSGIFPIVEPLPDIAIRDRPGVAFSRQEAEYQFDLATKARENTEDGSDE
jgi:hypothetical protein